MPPPQPPRDERSSSTRQRESMASPTVWAVHSAGRIPCRWAAAEVLSDRSLPRSLAYRPGVVQPVEVLPMAHARGRPDSPERPFGPRVTAALFRLDLAVDAGNDAIPGRSSRPFYPGPLEAQVEVRRPPTALRGALPAPARSGETLGLRVWAAGSSPTEVSEPPGTTPGGSRRPSQSRKRHKHDGRKDSDGRAMAAARVV